MMQAKMSGILLGMTAQRLRPSGYSISLLQLMTYLLFKIVISIVLQHSAYPKIINVLLIYSISFILPVHYKSKSENECVFFDLTNPYLCKDSHVIWVDCCEKLDLHQSHLVGPQGRHKVNVNQETQT